MQKLIARLTDHYGVPESEVSSLDEHGLMRAVAAWDFLANNLPPATPTLAVRRVCEAA
jgi:hypothetical protein